MLLLIVIFQIFLLVNMSTAESYLIHQTEETLMVIETDKRHYLRDEIVKLRGQRFADSKMGQSLIARTKKLLLIRNPDMARAYKTFYSQSR